MEKHVHSGVTFVLLAGLSAILIENLVRLAAAQAVDSDLPWLRTLGKAAGALVPN